MKIITTLICLQIAFLSFGQAKKGDWLIKGSGASINTTRPNGTNSNIQFDIALGHFINNQWMVGGGVGIRLTETTTLVNNGLFGRYYFKDTLKTGRLYLEGRWEIAKFAPIGVGQGSQRFTSTSAILAAGADFFLSRHLAIELQLDYYFLNRIKRFDQDQLITSDYFTFNVGFQYFFRYRDFRKERLIDYRKALDKGTWFVGGEIALHDPPDNIQWGRSVQHLSPLAGKFILKNWAVGTALVYSAESQYRNIYLGLSPFSRYYINVGRKKKLFVELNGSYQMLLTENSTVGYLKTYYLYYGGAIGWSNFINRNVSFDILYSFNQDYRYREDFSKGKRLSTSRGLSFALQYFFEKKSL